MEKNCGSNLEEQEKDQGRGSGLKRKLDEKEESPFDKPVGLAGGERLLQVVNDDGGLDGPR